LDKINKGLKAPYLFMLLLDNSWTLKHTSMETKKNPSLDLDQKRGYFLNIGLCISLSLLLFAFEWKTEIIPQRIFDESDILFGEENIPEVPLTYQTPPPPKIINPIIEIVSDQIPIPDGDIIIDLGTEATPDIVLEGPLCWSR
jgi:periplasmic protein TonB